MIKLCIRKPFIIFVSVIICLTLAAISLMNMGTDFLPEMDLPYMVVITTYPGATPEKVETNVTEPLEKSLGTVSHVSEITSTSAENYSMVMLEFEEDTDMDASMVRIRSAIDTVDLPETCGSPTVMEVSMDMMATQYVAASYEGMDIYEISDFIEETVSPYFERQDGVASLTTIGLVDKYVEVRLDQDKIDKINDKILAKADDSLAEAEQKIEDSKQELADARAELESGKADLESQQNTTANELGEATLGLNQALATQTAYEAELNSLQANQTALETEKQAYEEAKVQENYDQINSLLASLSGEDTYNAIYNAAYQTAYETIYQKTYEAIRSSADLKVAVISQIAATQGLEIEVTADNVEAIYDSLDEATKAAVDETLDSTAKTQAEDQAKTLADTEAKTYADTQIAQFPKSIAEAIANPTALETLKTYLESAGQAEAAEQLTVDNLTQLNEIVTVRLPQIDTELANLSVEIVAAQTAYDTVSQAVSSAMSSYTQAEAAKILAAAGFGSASAQLAAGESSIESGEKQLEEAEESFENAKKTARENANIDALLDMSTLSGILYAQNFDMPAGYIDDENDNQWMLKIGENITSVKELKNLLLTNIDGVGDIRLKDVAVITTLDNAGDSYTKVNGQDAVLLSIYKASTASTSAVSNNCKAAAAALEEEYPGLHLDLLMDQGNYIAIFIKNILVSMILGMILAVFVLAVFLKNIKPTLIVAFSIPFSVLVAVLLMYFSGITLNIMSLSGLSLSIGMLVDNSVVVIENILRLRDKGISAPRAALQGTKQVAASIIASTLTTVCVFLPMIFTSGLVRQLILPMALTITFTLFASLIVALTVVPTLGSLALKKHKPRKKGIFDRFLGGYGKVLSFCLKRKFVPLLIAVGLLAVSVYATFKIGVVLLPDMASDTMSITVTCDDAEISKDDSYAIADEVMEDILSVDHLSIVGGMNNVTSLMSSMAPTDYTTYMFYVVPDDTITKESQIYDLVDQMTEATKDVKGAAVEVSASPLGVMSSYLGEGLTIELYGEDLDQLLATSEDFMDMIGQVDGFEDISNAQEGGDKTLHLTIDRDKAMALGLTIGQIYTQLSEGLTTEKTATTITVDDYDYDVVIVNENDLLTKEDLLDETFEVTVKDDDGNESIETHTLSEFGSLEESEGLETINRQNNSRYIEITASVKDGYNLTRLTEQVKTKLDAYEMPNGMSWEISGEYENVMKMISQLLLMAAVGLLFIYLVMVAQFQSLLSPFIILLTIPLAFTGGLLALIFAGEQVSVMSLVGFLVLMGTVVNNGIVFVDYTNQLRLGGVPKREALIAAGKTRMRPILMTALTTILAMCAMIFDQSTSASMSRGMALVVAGGLAYATLMTLFIVPVMYDILYRKKPQNVDLGDETMDDVTDDAADVIKELENEHKNDT